MTETTTTVSDKHHQPNYAAVFWSLFFLTMFEIAAANLPFTKIFIILILLALAIVKAGLVALFYMHLKYEKYVIYVIVIFPLILAVILTVSVLLDKVQVFN